MMRVSIERLRVWLLVGACLLVLVIASFLGYAHFRARRFLHDLPGRLAADITRESNGFTYSQSFKGKTLYTIHAAKLVQRKDGKTTLRDVGIVLYGQKQDRADRIYGSEFEYDQKAGVIRALGIVHLDLQAPAPQDARSRAEYVAGQDTVAARAHGHQDLPGTMDERVVHCKTSGLVFVQSLGVASTDQPVEFQYKGLTGEAKGADYSSDTGITVLQSDVRVSGLHNGQPALLTASHAEMDRTKQQLTLTRARYVSVGEAGSSTSAAQTLTADQAIVHLRGDGSAERLLANGNVTIEQAGSVLRSHDADVAISTQDRPQTVRLTGGVTFTESDPLRENQSHASQAIARFDDRGRVQYAEMTDGAEVHLRERASPPAPWNDRRVRGDRIDLNFALAEGGKQWLREAVVTGSAQLHLVDHASSASGPRETTTDLRAHTLTAALRWNGHGAELNRVTGQDQTEISRTDTAGAQDTSHGETLDISFAPPSRSPSTKQLSGDLAQGTARITTAVQRGRVVLTHLAARRSGDSADTDPLHAKAAEARFDDNAQTLTLSGQVQVTQAESEVQAAEITLARNTGDTQARGSVEVSYRQQGASQITHVLSAAAEFHHQSGQAIFHGAAGATARLWQGASQVEAETIAFNQKERTLAAGTGTQTTDVVHTTLVGGEPSGPTRNPLAKRPASSRVVRITSRNLRYTEADRLAVFTGAVALQDANGTIRASVVTALLKPTVTPKPLAVKGNQSGFMSGSVDHVVAEGGVEVSEPDRHASGDRLLYTAVDGKFVMTGTPSAPPRVVDEVQGTVTGTTLEFHAGDNAIMVLGGTKGGERSRVRTETQVRPQ